MNIFENKRFSKIIFNLIEKALGIKKGSIIDLKEQTQENEKNKGRGKYIYEQLSPKVNDDERYINEIDQGVDNKDIKNIALSGSYGSGKSSILKTYISKRDQRKYLNVSLAKFTDLQKNSKKETGKDTGNDSNKDVNIVNELEENILKQMFYKVHHNKIPYSRYKRIKNIRTMELLVYIVLFILIIISGIVIFNPKLLVNFDKNKDILKELKVNDLTILQMWAIFVITSFIAGIKLLKYFIVNLKLSNIKTKNIEITKSDNSSSIFNKNIDEILYFFEVNKYDVVIFEDIDRFDNLEIFVKLRELNDLINNSDQIDGKVTFIYAIKDDIFSDYKERTKFFDLIIPVIPIINSSNSLGIIKNKLKEFNIEAKLMDDISIYIDDMRLLINICNEFKLYKSVLEDIDESKLFAMIVYKNIYPSDFVKLQFNEGMIGELFDYKNKRDIINKIIKDLDQKYIDLENKIEKANEEFIDSIDELKSIYLEDISDRYSDIHIGNNYYKNYKDLKKVIFTDETKLEDNIEFTDFNGSRRRVSIKELSRYNEEDSYYKRKEIIELKKDDNLEKLKNELHEINAKKQKISLYKMHELIKEFDIDKIITDEKLRKESLLIYLISNSYIDEMYNSYLTHFHGGSLSKEDMNFIKTVQGRLKLDFDYPINNITNVMAKIYPSDCESISILNYNILDFIIKNKQNYIHHYNNILKQLSNESNESISFIDSYIDISEVKGIFISDLAKVWTNVWIYICLNSNYTKEKKDECLIELLEKLDIKDLVKINKNNSLASNISGREDFLILSENIEDKEKIKKLIKKLDVKFSHIFEEIYDKDLLDYIYDNNLYCINYNMIRFMISVYSEDISIDKLKISNCTTIRYSNCKKLIEYIDDNINEYIENVFLRLKNNVNEKEDTILYLLNNKNILEHNKISIIEKQDILINDLGGVPEDLRINFFKLDKFIVNWYNISVCSVFEDESILVNFLNKEENYIRLSNEDIGREYEIESSYIECICKIILTNDDINKKSFEHLLDNTKYICDIYLGKNKSFEEFVEYNLNIINYKKVKIIIDKNIIKLNIENYKTLKAKPGDEHIHLIENNIDVYLNNINKYDLSINNTIELLESSKIDNDHKSLIINNLDVEDKLLIADDSDIDRLVKYLLNYKYKLKYEILNYVINSDISIENKVFILSNQIEHLDEDYIDDLLRKLGDNYKYIVDKGRLPILYNNYANIKLVNALINKKYISTWGINKDNKIKVNRKTKSS